MSVFFPLKCQINPHKCRAPLGVIQPKDLSMISKIGYDIAEILLRLALNTNQSINQSINQNRLWFHMPEGVVLINNYIVYDL